MAAHEAREPLWSRRLEPAFHRAFAHDPPSFDWHRFALELDATEIGADEGVTKQAMRARGHENRVRSRQLLQVSSEIWCLAENRLLLGRSFTDDLPNDHQSGCNAHSDLQRLAGRKQDLAHLRNNAQPC